jgi:regulator of protease activity HflC (stomatin/prohibitin superfamily)
MDIKIKRAGGWNTFTALMGLGAGLITLLASRTGSMPAPLTSFVFALLLIGFLVALVSSFHLHLVNREQLEQLEHEEVAKGSEGTSMFESDAFPARRSREQFDRWVVPVFTLVLLMLEGAGAGFIAWGNPRFNDFSETQALGGAGVVVAISVVFGMFLYLRGRYATLLSAKMRATILQPGSDFLLLSAHLFFLQAVASAVALLGYPIAHQYFALGLCAFMCVLAVETLLRMILDIYRPRMKGQEVRQLYHSRLVGLVSKPEGFFATAAHTLDYQFGFKVSETWGYRFLRDRLGLIVLLQVFVLWLSSSVVIIPQSQVGYVERNGMPIDIRQPGISFKLPWPVDRVERHFMGEVRLLYIGPELDPERLAGRSFFWYDDENTQMVEPRLAQFGPSIFSSVWAEPNVADHGKHSVSQKLPRTYFATRDSGDRGRALLFLGAFVQFHISDVKKYASFAVRPEEVLEKHVTREITRHFLRTDANYILTYGQEELARSIKGAVQERAKKELGIEILNVGLSDVQPPPDAAVTKLASNTDPRETEETDVASPAQKYEEKFKRQIARRHQESSSKLSSESIKLLAEIDQANTIAIGQLEADDILRKADSEKEYDDEFYDLCKKSPRVFPAFQLIDAWTNYIGSVRSKVIHIGVDVTEYEFDLKEDSLDLTGAGMGVPLKGN